MHTHLCASALSFLVLQFDRLDIVVCVFGQAPPKELVSAGMSLNSTLAPEETSAKEQDKESNGTSTQDLF